MKPVYKIIPWKNFQHNFAQFLLFIDQLGTSHFYKDFNLKNHLNHYKNIFSHCMISLDTRIT